MNPDIERIQQWANQYETCAVNHVPGYLAPFFPRVWTFPGCAPVGMAHSQGQCNLRFSCGSVVGCSTIEYSKWDSLFDDLDAYIDFKDLFVADETAFAFDIDLEKVL